jgi:hypothetical protein
MSGSTEKVRLLSDDFHRDERRGAASPGALLAWLGGARASILRLCPGEQSFYAGLGAGVLLTGLFGGAAAALAVSYALHEPVRRLWPVALFWALTLVNIDRLLLLVTGSRSRLWAMVPRLFISALLGFLIAEPLTLRIFQPEINAQIAITQQQAQATQLAQVQGTYQPKIDADTSQIAALNNKLTSAQNEVTYYQFLARCEAGETDCSTTHRLGYGPYYYRYEQDAAVAEAHYRAIAPGIHSQIRALEGEISILNGAEVTAEQSVHAAIAGGAGWAARETALDQLMAKNSGMDLTVWLVRLAFVLVDLAPLIVKFIVILFGRQLYDEIAAADKERNRVQAHRLTELARLERNKVTRRADAEDEIDNAIVDAYQEERMAAAYGGAEPTGPAGAGRARAARIPALSLAEFAHESRIHERMAVAMARPLARLAWIGAGLLAALVVAVILVQEAAHARVAGTWLVLAALLAVAVLAAYSRGFRRGPAWALRAAFGVGLLGLIVPAAIIAMNA